MAKIKYVAFRIFSLSLAATAVSGRSMRQLSPLIGSTVIPLHPCHFPFITENVAVDGDGLNITYTFNTSCISDNVIISMKVNHTGILQASGRAKDILKVFYKNGNNNYKKWLSIAGEDDGPKRMELVASNLLTILVIGKTSSNEKEYLISKFSVHETDNVQSDMQSIIPTATSGASPSDPTINTENSFPTMNRTSSGADFDAAAAVSGKDPVTAKGSPQYKALHWIINDDRLKLTVMAESNITTSMGLTSTTEDIFVQRYSLATLIFALTDGDLTHATQLLPSEGRDLCSLQTVECNNSGKITSINFANMGLAGYIPEEIGQFALTLTKMNLANNVIGGKLPNALYDLRMLTGLYLKSNMLSGTLSDQFDRLDSLKEFYAGENGFTGQIPDSFQFCKELRSLSLYKNKFTGTLPNWTKEMPRLFMLDLGHNNLSGRLSESLVGHQFLHHIFLDHNGFTGTIPATYPSMSNGRLKQLFLDHNQLTGQVPKDWWNGLSYQDRLLALRFDHNSFSTKLDKKLCKLFVLDDNAELVELSADCDICSCEICKPYCSQ